MLHLFALASTDGEADVHHFFNSIEEYLDWLGDSIAEQFNEYAGDQIKPREHIMNHGLIIDTSLNVGLAVVISAAKTSKREGSQRKIEAELIKKFKLIGIKLPLDLRLILI